jgi:hypothetical protein
MPIGLTAHNQQTAVTLQTRAADREYGDGADRAPNPNNSSVSEFH